MGTHHGNDGTAKVGADTIGHVKDWSLDEEIDSADTSAMGDAWETHLTGRKKWSGSVSAHWDLGDAGQQALTLGASVSLKLYPDGATTGDKYYSGTATITKLGVRTPMNDIVEISFDFKGNGALSEATVS